MAMRARMWSLNGLSVELGVGVRSLAKKLKHVRPDGKIEGRDGWFMTTVVRALGRSEQPQPDRGYSGGRDGVTDEIEQLAARLDAGFKQMAAEPNLERRRALGAEIGPLIGKLDRAFTRSRDSLPSESQAFAKFGTNQILRETIANFLALCKYEYVPGNTDAA